jgi:hypothetical protein
MAVSPLLLDACVSRHDAEVSSVMQNLTPHGAKVVAGSASR